MVKKKTVAERIAAENSQVPMCGLFNRFGQMYAALRKLADAVEGSRKRYFDHDGSPKESAEFVFDELDAALAEARK